MSREIRVAIIEDDAGDHHQFHAYSEDALTSQIAGWVRENWLPDVWGPAPEDNDAAIEDFFQKHTLPPSNLPGWECVLWRAEPIEIEEVPAVAVSAHADLLDIPVGAAVLIRRGGHIDPPNLTPPSKGCYRDVKATYLGSDTGQRCGVRCRLEQDDPGDTVGWSKRGQEGYWSVSCVRLDPDAQMSGCTFEKGDKDPCPTCPRLITCLHSCGLLQDELATLHNETEPTT